ncbi:MAG: hypothetical protein JWN76_1797 [Chitinophagaceae bacterium]|nr:hypothetical protein [Chitinophagaceae bacterium]
MARYFYALSQSKNKLMKSFRSIYLLPFVLQSRQLLIILKKTVTGIMATSLSAGEKAFAIMLIYL